MVDQCEPGNVHTLNSLYSGELLVLHHPMVSGKTECSASTSWLTSEKYDVLMCWAQDTCVMLQRHWAGGVGSVGFKSLAPVSQRSLEMILWSSVGFQVKQQ